MRYGWIPDLPDNRDYVYIKFRGKLPEKVDLRAGCSPVEDQGQLGSCTGQAIAGALEYLDKQDGSYIELSRLFIYYNERVIEGTVHHDAGAMIRDGIKACVKLGTAAETLWPYNIRKFTTRPCSAAYKDARNRKIISYHRVTSLIDVLQALSEGLPVIFGFSVYESFESDVVAKTGEMPFPGRNERLLGGHAVLAVGYDQATSRLIVRNSWGEVWGQNGYFTMPFDVISNSNMSDDFWVIRK